MEVKLITIGNSKGVRIPKTIIEKYQMHDALDLIETEEGLLIRPASEPRKGWGEQFEKAKATNVSEDDFSDVLNVSNHFDDKEWTW